MCRGLGQCKGSSDTSLQILHIVYVGLSFDDAIFNHMYEIYQVLSLSCDLSHLINIKDFILTLTNFYRAFIYMEGTCIYLVTVFI